MRVILTRPLEPWCNFYLHIPYDSFLIRKHFCHNTQPPYSSVGIGILQKANVTNFQASLLLMPLLLPEKSWKVQLCPNFPELITHPLNQKEPRLHGSWLLIVEIFLQKWSCTDSVRVSTKKETIRR